MHDLLHQFIDLFIKLPEHLDTFVAANGAWTYGLLALIIFAETGLVITPFLPGDSLLFAAGALAARGSLNVGVMIAVLLAAAIVGDAVNYAVGRFFRSRVLAGGKVPLVKQAHLDKTHAFFEKYGAKAIVIARFVPIVRTVAPFVAGVGEMKYRTFAIYNVVGAVLWVLICCGAGYFFGNLQIVKKNFSLVILGIIAISLLPMAVEFALAWRARRAMARIEGREPGLQRRGAEAQRSEPDLGR
jgi:membrane-associated protein